VSTEAATGGSQARLFEVLLGLLGRLGRQAPVVLVVEDLHWADRSTRDLLAFLVRNLRAERVLLVATYRSDELHRRHPMRPFLAELARGGRVQRVDLAPFGREELATLLAGITGVPPTAATVDDILARTEGNGFFAEELFISSKTASVHVSNILAKLAVGNRVEAAAAALRLGIVDRQAR
jgi:predicted ATPase